MLGWIFQPRALVETSLSRGCRGSGGRLLGCYLQSPASSRFFLQARLLTLTSPEGSGGRLLGCCPQTLAFFQPLLPAWLLKLASLEDGGGRLLQSEAFSLGLLPWPIQGSLQLLPSKASQEWTC